MTVDDVRMEIVDVETVEAIDRLGDSIAAVESSLGNRIDAVETTLGNRIDAVHNSLGEKVANVRTELAALRTELRQGWEENRRSALMLNESTRQDIQMVAEGVASLAVKIDSLHRP
jgi:hypothetical protein